MISAGRWVTHYSVPGGIPFRVWEKRVPRIADSYTNCAVYIYRSLSDAKAGVSIGGSGFIVCMPLEKNPEMDAAYVITNRHVIAKAETPVIRLNRKDGKVECLETTPEQWHFHPDGDDVVAFPLDLDGERIRELRVNAIGTETFLTKQVIEDEDVGVGDETVMIGRFISHGGRQQNNPAVRFGNIAMMPNEPIISSTGIRQESFLVEIRSLPGYSGSPVILYSDSMADMSTRRAGKKNPGKVGIADKDAFDAALAFLRPKGPYLLGVDWCHLFNEETVFDGDLPIGRVRVNSGMAGVIPSWKIMEVLNMDELSRQREELDEEIERSKRRSCVSLDSADEPPFTSQDFDAALKKVSRKVGKQEAES